MSFTKFVQSNHYFLKYFLCPILFLFSFQDSSDAYLRPDALFIFKFLFSLFFSFDLLYCSIFKSTDSSSVHCLLLNLSLVSEFLFSNIVFSVLRFLFGSFHSFHFFAENSYLFIHVQCVFFTSQSKQLFLSLSDNFIIWLFQGFASVDYLFP